MAFSAILYQPYTNNNGLHSELNVILTINNQISYFPAAAAFSIYANVASRPFSCATALLSVTNFLIRPRYLENSGLFSLSIVWKSFAASS